MASNPFAAYLETKVLSTSPLQLVYLAYEGAIEAVTEARGHLQQKRIHERAHAITRAQLFIAELQSALDYDKGGSLSVQLARLYDYMQRSLIDANFKQIEQPLADVQGLLETLASAWKEIAEKESDLPASPSTSSFASTSESTPAPAAGGLAYSLSANAVEPSTYSWSGGAAYGQSAYARAEYTF